MAGPLVSKRKLLGMVVETTKGTYSAPSAPMSGTVVYDPVMTPEGVFDGGERAPDGAYSGTVNSVLHMHAAKLTFRTEVRNGDQTLALLRGCGFNASGSPSSSQATHATLSFALWEDGRRKRMSGSCGTVKFAPDGARLMAEWEFSGVWIGVDDAAMPSQTVISSPGMRTKGATIEWDGNNLPYVREWSIDIGAEVQARENAEANSGIAHYVVVDRRPQITINHEAALVATHDAYGDMLNGETASLTLEFSDGTNTITFTAANAQRLSIGSGDANKHLMDELTLACHQSTGDDDLVIAFA